MINWDKVTENTIKKIVFYGRVSTQHEAQLMAFENQQEWYNQELEKHTDWELAAPIETYLDKGITGTQAKKRPGFLKMIEDAERGKFDMVVTREVSRFARNTVDALDYVRKLKRCGVQVYFVHDNIKTIEDNDGELRLSIMATLAQDESRKISERVKAGQKIARDEGVLYGNGNILGYNRIRTRRDSDKKNNIGDKNTPTFVKDPDQAVTVQMMFNLYKNGYGLKKIKNELVKAGRKNTQGEVKWHQSTISHMLENPMYIGKQYQMQSSVQDFVEHTIVKNDKSQFVLIEGDFEPIIDEETFWEVQRIKKSKLNNFEGKIYGLKVSNDRWQRKLECVCGSRFQVENWRKNKDGNDIQGYVCRHKRVYGSRAFLEKNNLPLEGSCDMPSIPAWKFDYMGLRIFNEVWGDKKQYIVDAFQYIVDSYVTNKNDETANIEKLQKQIDRFKSKIDSLIELYTDGELTKTVFNSKKADYETRIEEIKQELMNCNTVEDNEQQDLNELKVVQETLAKMVDFSGELLDNDLLNNYVDKVVVNAKSDFDWYINLSGDGTTFTLDYLEQNRLSSYEKRAENTLKMRDEKYTLMFTMYLNYDDAKAYKVKFGKYLKEYQWEDLLVKVYIRCCK